MEQDQEGKLIHDTATELLEEILRAAEAKDVCAHCLGLDVIYMIAREITLNTDAEAGEILNSVHLGIVDGVAERDEAEGEETPGPRWTVH